MRLPWLPWGLGPACAGPPVVHDNAKMQINQAQGVVQRHPAPCGVQQNAAPGDPAKDQAEGWCPGGMLLHRLQRQ